MTSRTPRLTRLALLAVPRAWRASVAQDLMDEARAGWSSAFWSAAEAVGIGIALHWTFTRAALAAEIRYTVKSMLHAPAFALGAVATFALGIGVNVAVFSAVDRMLFRPLPYDHPERLVVMGQYPVGSTQPYGTVPALYVVQARRAPAVEELTISEWSPASYRLTQEADGARYFSFVPFAYTALKTLGVRPVLGLDFTVADARAKPHRVLISYDLWQRELGGRADVVGRTLWGQSAVDRAEIAGVLPRDFIPPQVTQPTLSWSGIAVNEDTFASATPRDRATPPVVRLKANAPVAEAQAQIDAIVASLAPQFPAPPGSARTEVRLVPLRDALFGRYQTYVALIFAAATMVLLIGCANLASLLGVRARAREHRAALQLALGASPSRLIQSAVIEALMLAGTGCVVALVVLRLATQAMAAWLPAIFSRYAAPVFASRVLIFSAAVATASALVAGVVPGWRTSRVDVLTILQRGTGRAGSGRLRGAAGLLALEIAVSTVLVACAVLTGRTLLNLVSADIGFNPDRLLGVRAYLPQTADQRTQFRHYSEMLEILRNAPGMESAAGADVLPIIGAAGMRPFLPDGRGFRWAVTEGFVETLGMRVLAGRTFRLDDVQSSAAVAMLSQSGVSLVWPGLTPDQAIGRSLQVPGEPLRDVIGVVSDVRYPYSAQASPSLFVPIDSTTRRGEMMYAVRTTPERAISDADLTHLLNTHGYRPDLIHLSPIASNFAASVVDQRFRAELFAGFGLVAVVLAVIGVYAVQSFTVMLRLSEFGIRVSLGAEPRDLWRLLIAETMRPAVAGVALGLIGTYWAGQFLQAFLFGVTARDPWTFGGVALLLLLVAAVAVWVPARRASQADPAVVLRAQ